MLSNCAEMLIHGTYWKTWYSVVSEQTCTGPKLVTNDYLDWSLPWIIHVNTNSTVMWVILPNNAYWDCFQDSDFAVYLEDPKYTSGGTLCVFGSHTFVPTSWMCKISVSHSSTESEISSDAGLRLDGIPALDLWDLIVCPWKYNSEPW